MVRDNKGRTPLHCGASGGHTAVVQYLINDCHCDPTTRTGYGWTPLHWGAAQGHTAAVQYLLSIPTVDSLARDEYNRTPLKIAAECGTLDIMAPIFEKFGKIRISHSVGSFVNVFLLGDPKAGKTTLTQVIKDRASSFFRFGSVKQVKSSTAGIVPTIYFAIPNWEMSYSMILLDNLNITPVTPLFLRIYSPILVPSFCS